MILEAICVGLMQTNCYILASLNNTSAIIIDPGDEEEKIKKHLNKYRLKAGMIINTHGHIDHIGCDDKFDAPVYIHRQDLALLRSPELNLSSFLISSFSVKSKIYTLEDKEDIQLGEIKLQTIHLPGHTPGGIALWLKEPISKILFTGDSLFYQGIGRTDFPGADERLLIKSIKDKLWNFADDTVIYPGHGPSSTIGEEKKSNPFLI